MRERMTDDAGYDKQSEKIIKHHPFIHVGHHIERNIEEREHKKGHERPKHPFDGATVDIRAVFHQFFVEFAYEEAVPGKLCDHHDDSGYISERVEFERKNFKNIIQTVDQVRQKDSGSDPFWRHFAQKDGGSEHHGKRKDSEVHILHQRLIIGVNISDSVVSALRLEEFGNDPQTIVSDEDQQQPAQRVVNGSGSRITFRL